MDHLNYFPHRMDVWENTGHPDQRREVRLAVLLAKVSVTD